MNAVMHQQLPVLRHHLLPILPGCLAIGQRCTLGGWVKGIRYLSWTGLNFFNTQSNEKIRRSSQHFLRTGIFDRACLKAVIRGKNSFLFSTNFIMLHKILTQARISLSSAENSLHNYGLCFFQFPNGRSERTLWMNRMGRKSLENVWRQVWTCMPDELSFPLRIRAFLLNLN